MSEKNSLVHKRYNVHRFQYPPNPFPNKPWFLRVCSKSLLKTLWEKEKLLVTSCHFHQISNCCLQNSFNLEASKICRLGKALPHMPILHSSNSAANKDMSKILTNEDTIF